MRNSVFCQDNHSDDIAVESGADIVRVDVCNILAVDLLRRIVDEYVDSAGKDKVSTVKKSGEGMRSTFQTS